jgi:hypothetical protein
MVDDPQRGGSSLEKASVGVLSRAVRLPPFDFAPEVADAVRQKLQGIMVWRPLILLDVSFFFRTVSRALES